ncbi:MAG TPA: hypothetical protein PL017_12235 [Tenuifilaceae bacterium]|nr:hypothetical protein [Tenuifilaceae bacterium]HPE19307.1 hypothetical protein [Tenuifilaceae bacterium]HPJ46859.1 hypothetical protein [Tenuifilaceae bacterium]HPQ35308.1 hypothetical protein [Tenuifilaceae bacterium]HRX69046.1 hypothetical protein [Tenuifilaceae bacterium]
MATKDEHIKDLQEIRSMMERSSRFISLSGLSGVFAGITALLGALAVYIYKSEFFYGQFHNKQRVYFRGNLIYGAELTHFIYFLIVTATIVLIVALTFGVLFTTRNARRKNLPYWDSSAKRMLINLFIPLAAGGIFCLALFYHQQIYLVAPATLVFYGIALINASKFTLNDIRYLGFSEIILGLISMFFAGYSLFFWAFGFGILHIIYGTTMYWKNERANSKS